MLLDHPIVSERYFFPRNDELTEPFWVSCDGAELACLWHRRGAPKTFLHFHGNGEVIADYLPDYVEAIAGLGVDVFMAEYRGYGASTGEPALARMLDDVERIFASLGLAESEVIVYGRSVGALYAVEAAHRHPGICGLILESGIADLLERLLIRVTPEELGASPEELAAAVAERFDHQAKLGGYRGPLLCLHARDDELVDWSHASRHHQWGGGEDKELVLFDWGGHNALMASNWPRYLGAIEEFISRIGR